MTDDAWIDLDCLINCSTYEDDLLVIHWQRVVAGNDYNGTVAYNLRKALRAVGHRFTSSKPVIDENCTVVQVSFETTVTKEEGERMSRLYNEWVSTIETEEYESD